MVDKKIIDLFRVSPKTKVSLAAYDPGWVGGEEMQGSSEAVARQRALELLEKERGVLAEAQGRLYASDEYAVLLILHGMTDAGLDEVVKHVMTGVNPQGCQVKTFGKPSAEELDHDFLWRYTRAIPERGRIGIFDGSYYDEVVSARVNPKILASEKLPGLPDGEGTGKEGEIGKSFWKDRYKSINNFENHLWRNGIVALKIFLHISKEEQKRRILEMIGDPAQRWNYSPAVMEQRKAWDTCIEAYEDAISATSTEIAPWYVIPADHHWVAEAMVADLLTDLILNMGVDYPKLPKEKLNELQAAKEKLQNE
jgi:PPK2 family polyphosphate:nucleotide phosphotransferase